MKSLSALCACLLLLTIPAMAQPIPNPPSTPGDAYILMDADTGRVLATKKADKRHAPASLTKLMTAYGVFKSLEDESLSVDDKVEISKEVWQMGGSQMFLEVGDKVTVDNLLDGMLIQSGNDAALALAERVGGSKQAFVEQMDYYADQLDMDGTHFTNPEGLPGKNHYSTAHDLARLARAIISEYPDRYKRFGRKKFTFNGIPQHNRNDLLYSTKYVDGMKTGHTEDAGYCLAASGKRDGTRLISVVLGEPSDGDRASSSRSLLSWGFRFYDTHQLYSADKVLKKTRIYQGAQDEVRLGLAKPLYVTIPKGQYGQLKASMVFPDQLVAPAEKGEQLGRVEVKLGDKTVAEAPLIALSAVPAGNLVQRWSDHVIQWFQ